MGRPFSPRLSLAIDRAVIGRETTGGLRRLVWRVWFWWLTRDIP